MKSLLPSGILLVTGGAASGKSALAEGLCCRAPGPRLYIATMEPHGEGAAARIARHRDMRADKGFKTVERYRDLAGLVIPSSCGAALLEDTGNLVANEMFGGGRMPEDAAKTVLSGIRTVADKVETLVIVHNEIFSGAERYGAEMEAYLACMGQVACRIAEQAVVVVEAVCGLPQIWKGELAL